MLPLEKTLVSVLATDRNAGIVARHYGFDGRGGANFQRTGNEFGITRERVRQIVSASDPHRHLLPEAGAAVDRLIDFISARIPAPAAEVEAKLHLAGLALKPFRMEGIVNIAGLLGRTVPFRIGLINKARLIVPGCWPSFHTFVGRVRERVRRNGMAKIAEFTNDLPAAPGAGGTASLIEIILSGQPDFRWLDREAGWFWLAGTSPNCAVKRIRKMLAVANPLAIAELRAGLARMISPLAPESTLAAFCRQQDWLSVRGDLIYATPCIDAAEVLNKTEHDIYRLLSGNNGCMSNSELISRANRLGMKRPTFYQCVTYSPIVTRYNGRNYRLIGLRPESPAQPVVTPGAQAAAGGS
jgi:hypothetical protein